MSNRPKLTLHGRDAVTGAHKLRVTIPGISLPQPKNPVVSAPNNVQPLRPKRPKA